MPSKDRDVDLDSVADEGHRDRTRHSKSERSKTDRDRDKDKDKDRQRERRHHRSSRSSASRSKLGTDDSEASTRRHRDKDRDRDRKRDEDKDKADNEPRETNGSASDITAEAFTLDRPRISMPYPSFSKAHCKEAVMSRDDLGGRQKSSLSNPPTPEPTDIGEKDRRSRSAELHRTSSTADRGSRPPTPPETDVSADKRRAADDIKGPSGGRSRSTASALPRSASHNDDRSKISRKSASSSQATYIKTREHKTREHKSREHKSREHKSHEHKSHEKLRSSGSVRSSSSRHSTRRSDSTRSSSQRVGSRDDGSSPSSVPDSSPQTPTQSARFPSHMCDDGKHPASTDLVDSEPAFSSKTATPASMPGPPPPPPPPPPAIDIHDIPRVDYLLQNGGLPYPVPRHFLSVLPLQNTSRTSNPPLTGSDVLFAPFLNLLDQYSNVLVKQGSIAVATGHRSVARRLLDRLENVFSRDLPPHGCACVMCDRSHEIHKGLTWGDVLEWVSGRIELPDWPPFDLAEIGTKAAEISAEAPPRPASPVKMDPDIAEEFREHYLRQSKKVRSAVDRWLNNTSETPAPPPQDVDDETLAFAILTNMDVGDRPFFNALLSGSRELKPSTRAPTPVHRPRNDFIVKSGLSLQRLYRLPQVPRDAEAASYLVKNPHTHDLLVTISSINNAEWEILTSGRFDGFLWSGADADDMPAGLESRAETPASGFFGSRCSASPQPRGPSATGSRTTTPFSPYSRGATPASFVSLASSGVQGSNRQPVSNDEEMEMAAIAEIEREIYAGMESLEDAFEKLHQKAEMVRAALRQRGAALMQNLQSRRRIDVLPTPGSGNSQHSGYERPAWAVGSDVEGASDDDWAMDDMDIMPDDSASNISSSRHRRPKRRTERRTPAPIEEDEEE
ncbi:uncharacterized protein MAM_01753 [Metarhizium album ARSEF 1941]|uniref:5-Methylcytosine G/T mismatch-specific DNA glycosylase n=1 Tax=Metarhizium album (strain ARSEF 1941) TaxID=1081103 RepID=A0A0B2X671_METAS|nr:uncharacterized protein MAM_01753 [Metarhizium album ARSEF 1941]KHO00975.1 hypothetical protein MAM_01753 [Metarhizium album ARSEF 1941]